MRHLFALLIAALLIVPSASSMTLVEEGRPVFTIILENDATSSAKAAAQELQYHIEKMSGARLPIQYMRNIDGSPRSRYIFIGGVRIGGITEAIHSQLPKEGYTIRTLGNSSLLIIGDDSDDRGPADNAFFDDHDIRTGTLFGVYALLQDQLGCRWIWPGESGEVIPRRETIELPELDIIEGPALYRRSFRILQHRDLMRPWPEFFDADGTETLRKEQRVWARRMRLGRSANPQMDSPFNSWWQRYGVKHPDIFALKADGSRGPGSNLWHIHMCVSNPKLWEMQIAWFKKTRARFPDRHDLGASESARNDGYCTCDNCRAWDVTTENLPKEVLDKLDPELVKKLKPGPDGLPRTLSTRYARYYNELARRVRELDPEGFITARPQFPEPPIGVDLEPNILTRFDGLSTVPATDEERAAIRRSLTDWTPPNGMVMVRINTPLPLISDNGMPFNVTRELADNVSFGLKSGARILDINSMFGHWASWGPAYYIITRMAWQGAGADPDALADEWFAAFGPADAAVRDYYDFWERRAREVATQSGAKGRAAQLGQRLNVRAADAQILLIGEDYSPEILAEARELLNKAVAAGEGADEAVKERIRMIDISLTNADLTANTTRCAIKTYERRSAQPELESALKELQAYRSSVWPTHAVNVFVQTREEMARNDVLGWNLIEAVEE